jgi:hypothetical protein
MGKDKTLTSVKLPESLFEDFRVLTVRTKFTFQKLAERAMFLYVTDENFRKQIHEQLNTSYSGSI